MPHLTLQLFPVVACNSDESEPVMKVGILLYDSFACYAERLD